MSAKSAKNNAVPKQPSFIFMILKAIGGTKAGRKGSSRAAIANFIIENFNKTEGERFNYALRTAIKKGLLSGALRQGETNQRFKLGEKAKSITNPSKPKPKQKKKVASKKKVSKKKSTKKKKVAKKKKVSKKKVTKPKRKKQRKNQGNKLFFLLTYYDIYKPGVFQHR